MLQFFREKKHVIGWAIVIFFVGTLFTGSIFLGNFGDLFSSKKDNQHMEAVAMVGTTPITAQKYMSFLNKTLGRFKPEDVQRLDPEVSEFIQYSAFSEALQFTILLEGANESKVDVSSSEIDQAFESVYKDYDVKGMKELKELLKKANYPFKQFKQDLKEDLLTQKFANQLIAGVTVTAEDMQRFPTANPKEIQPKLLQAKQQQTLRNYVQQTIAKKQLVISNAVLKAYHGKAYSNLPMAIGAYQSQVSAAPGSPIPHYLLAKLYLVDKHMDEAEQELKKGSLKIELNKGLDFPSYHMLLGRVADEKGRVASKNAEYQLAFDLSGNSEVSLRQILQQFKEKKEKAWEKRVEDKLKGLNLTQK